MADYSMDDKSWKIRTELIIPWLENNDFEDKFVNILKWNLDQGETDPENRRRFWTSIRTLFGIVKNDYKELNKKIAELDKEWDAELEAKWDAEEQEELAWQQKEEQRMLEEEEEEEQRMLEEQEEQRMLEEQEGEQECPGCPILLTDEEGKENFCRFCYYCRNCCINANVCFRPDESEVFE